MSIVDEYLHPTDHPPLFTDRQWLHGMLRFEAALARAQAEYGLIPADAAQAIEQACQSVRIAPDELVAHARRTGALGMAIVQPLRQWLATHRPEGVDWLHWGTTTQDVVDSVQVLLTRQALQAIEPDLARLQHALQGLARRHARTPMLARSLLQPAQLTSFGLKCAQSAGALARSRRQLAHLRTSALCLQLGGAVGNRAGIGPQAPQVERHLAEQLGLGVAGYSWHTQRDPLIRLAMEAAVCCGSLEKLAKDWALLAQYEVGEISEAPRSGTSSAMPHKNNPVHCMQAIAQTQPVPQLAALLLGCMAQAHERALGEWQCEVAHWAGLWRHLHGAACALRMAAEGLQVHERKMQAHIDGLHEVIFSEAVAQALAPSLGKAAAQEAVAACAPLALERAEPLHRVLWQWLEQHHPHTCSPALRQALGSAVQGQRSIEASATCCEQLLARIEAMDQEESATATP